MSDSDQNERDRLPWWLKPLAGGRGSKEETAEEEVADTRPLESGSDARSAPETAVPPADEALAPEPEPPTEPVAQPSTSELWSTVESADLEGGVLEDDMVEDDVVEDADPVLEAGFDNEPERVDEGFDAEREAASEEEVAGDAESDDESAADSGAGRSRSRRRGKRGGKKKNGNSGRRRAESTAVDATFAVPEPDNVIEILPVPERTLSVNEERKLGVFCDFENIALGVRDSEIKRFDINIVLERLLDKGKILVKKAYADWERYSDYKRKFHESAIELIDIPQKHYSGKNSADIKMVVDALELSYTKEHLDTFVVMSGDSDFSPLVSKLKENNKYVIGVGVKNSSSNLLVDNCDEFIYYEDIWRDMNSMKKGQAVASSSKNVKSTEAFNLLVTSIKALMRDNKDVLWGSMIKQTMQRKKPSFNEGYYGYSTFSELLEDAERQKLVKLKKDQRSGTYIVTGFAGGR